MVKASIPFQFDELVNGIHNLILPVCIASKLAYNIFVVLRPSSFYIESDFKVGKGCKTFFGTCILSKLKLLLLR
jgi:hypothetical protein